MLNRRHFIQTAALAGGALALLPGESLAQALARLRIFVPAAPGGGWDQTARTIEAVLRANKQIETAQITNVGGAGGTVGLPQFVNQWKGQGDGLMVAGMVMVGAIIANKAAVNLTMTTPIARLTGEFEVIVVPANSPHQDMKSLIAAFKAKPEAVSWGGGSAGGTDHILAGMIAQAVGGDPQKVAYIAHSGGGPAVAAVLGGHVTAGVSGYGEFAEHIKSGKMRALAVSSEKRLPGLDIATLKEQGVDVELANWRAVFAPPGISDADRAKLTALIEAMAKSQAWQEELKKRDWTDILLTGKPFEDYIKSDTARIEGILKRLGLA